jgi:hypothetical protein
MKQTVDQLSEKSRRQRKMLLLLPVIVGPLLCLAFLGLSGGKGGDKHSPASPENGLNMKLPEAKLEKKGKATNKMGVYKQADQDTARLVENRKQDPYYAAPVNLDTGRLLTSHVPMGGMLAGLERGKDPVDKQADSLLKKMDLLKGILNKQNIPSSGPNTVISPYRHLDISDDHSLDKSFSTPDGSFVKRPLPGEFPPISARADPDLEKLGVMIDKIVRIKDAEEGKTKDNVEGSQEGRLVAQLTGKQREELIRTLRVADSSDTGGEGKKLFAEREHIPGPGGEQDSEEEVPGPGFIGLDEDYGADSVLGSAIEAVIARDQTLVSGESVELRLAQEAFINGVRIPRGTQLSGKATLSGERLLVAVSSIRLGKATVQVALEVVDMDGMAGIQEKGSINRDVSKESADEAISRLGVTSLDPSFKDQAAAAGLQAAKTLLSRKVRLVRVSVTAGYSVLLRNTKVNH